LSSSKNDYDNTCKILFSFLKNRGYTYAMMKKCKNEIWLNYREKTDENINVDKPIIPIILDYCSINQKLGKMYKDLLIKDKISENHKVVVAFKNSKNLKQILIRSKLENIANGHFYTCGNNRCNTCKFYAIDTTNIWSSHFNSKHRIQNKITCSTRNLIYLITCQKCHLQYVGETSRTLRDRTADHISTIKLKKQTPIGIHFNSSKHSVLDFKIVGIEAIENENTKLRTSREKFWQRTLGTLYPRGLNALEIN